MNKYFLLPTVSDRFTQVFTLLKSIKEFCPDWKLVVVAQEYDLEQKQALSTYLNLLNAVVLFEDKRSGCHKGNIAGLKHIMQESDNSDFVVCGIDDDMEFTKETNLDRCVQKCLEYGVGLVSGGWVKTKSMLQNRSVVDKFIKQAIVYTGGGLVFNHKIAKVLLEIPLENFTSTNSVWSLAVYVAGYENWRDRGSLAIHNVCQKGGRKGWISTLSTQVLSNPDFINTRIAKKDLVDKYLICDSNDLTDQAHELHRHNRALLIFKIK